MTQNSIKTKERSELPETYKIVKMTKFTKAFYVRHINTFTKIYIAHGLHTHETCTTPNTTKQF